MYNGNEKRRDGGVVEDGFTIIEVGVFGFCAVDYFAVVVRAVCVLVGREEVELRVHEKESDYKDNGDTYYVMMFFHLLCKIGRIEERRKAVGNRQ
jgi:hypothetical protein